MIRIAAVGDVHLGPDTAGRHRAGLAHVAQEADVLLLAGDLTRHGTPQEAAVVAVEYADLGLPVVAVLGKHDHHCGEQLEVARLLDEAGLTVLEGESVVLDLPAGRLGVAGAKGFGLGFDAGFASDVGEAETRRFVRHGRESAEALARALAALEGAAGVDVRVALTHYAPVEDTLVGEPPQAWPFLGNYLLGEAIDAGGCDLAVHGRAPAGTERGVTLGGVRVRNVAQPVIRAAYAVYEVCPEASGRGPL